MGDACTLKLEDRNNGELFAKCPIEQYPGVALESVSDSSRYFVVRIQDENGMFFMTSFQYFIKLLYIVIQLNQVVLHLLVLDLEIVLIVLI